MCFGSTVEQMLKISFRLDLGRSLVTLTKALLVRCGWVCGNWPFPNHSDFIFPQIFSSWMWDRGSMFWGSRGSKIGVISVVYSLETTKYMPPKFCPVHDYFITSVQGMSFSIFFFLPTYVLYLLWVSSRKEWFSFPLCIFIVSVF